MHWGVHRRGLRMRAYIKENLKTIISVAVILFCSVALIGTNEILAEVLPDIQEATLVSFEVEEAVHPYNGKEIKPAIVGISFEDHNGKIIKKSQKDIYIQKYINNVDCGYASVEVSVSGYHGTRLLENVFRIQPAQVEGLQVVQSAPQVIDITWGEIYGADGYYVYKSNDGGANYTLVFDAKAGNALTYQDTDVQLNASYMYYVSAYCGEDEAIFEGQASESKIQYTPLATPVLTAASNAAYNSIKLQWNVVEGAASYQIYRSLANENKYTCIAEPDGSATTYTDATCECGLSYSYYIKACQIVDAQSIYGDASNIMTAQTTPNRVGLSGTTTDGDTKVTLSWKKSTGAQGYEIYRSDGSTRNYKLVQDINNADTLSWSEASLNKASVYYYRIRPYCIVDGKRVVGSYSGTYEKVVTIVFDMTGIPDTMAAIMKYANGSTKVQYVWGGTSPSPGWDCSGFTQWVYKNHFGISIGRTAWEQNRQGRAINKNNPSEWQPGDILIYTEGNGPSHAALYLGNGQLIHALNTKWDTMIDTVSHYERWDPATSLMAVRRIFN